MPRYGKIYSMSSQMQDEASKLIESGKTEQQVADELNRLIAASSSGAIPDVTQQNVSAWKKRGHILWKQRTRLRDMGQRITQLDDIAQHAIPHSTDGITASLIAELAVETGQHQA